MALRALALAVLLASPASARPPEGSTDAPTPCAELQRPGARALCGSFGAEKTAEFSRSLAGGPEEAQRLERALANLLTDPKNGAFVRSALGTLPPAEWSFVGELAAAKDGILASAGQGSWTTNLAQDMTLNTCYKGTKCYERAQTVSDAVREHRSRRSWLEIRFKALPTERREHNIACWRHPASQTEIAFDAWRNTVGAPAEWWKANEADAGERIGRACAGRHCSACACLFQAYRSIKAEGAPLSAAEPFFGAYCPDHKEQFKLLEEKLGRRMRLQFGL